MMSKISKLFTPTNILVLSLLVLIIFLRFYRVADFFNFSLDEEYQAHLAASITKDFHIIWIGVNASNIGYYLGPGFTYLNALLFYMSHNDPVILGFFSSFLGVITTASIFYVTYNLSNKKSAFIAAILYGSSALMVFYDRRFWNPTFIPFISVWMIYSLIKAQKDTRWLVVSTFLMAASYHVHITLWIFWPLLVWVIAKNIKKIKIWTWLTMVGTYVVIMFPLMFFDYVHNYDNLLMPIRLIHNIGKKQAFDLSSHVNELVSTFGRIWYIKPFGSITDESVPGLMLLKTHGSLLLSIVTIGILIYFLLKASKKYNLIKWSLILFIAAFLFYPGVVSEYYLLGFFPLFIIAAAIIVSMMRPIILVPLLVLFICINTFAVITTSPAFGLTAKKDLIQKTTPYLDKDFYLTTDGTYKSFGGWRYLFSVYGKTPTQSQTDEYFGWIYQSEIKQEKPPLKVVITDQKPENKNYIKKISSAAYNAYIYKY